MNLPEKKVLRMAKPIPDSETDRVSEANELLSKLTPIDLLKLTTWEVEMINSIREGRAVTRIRLKELRDAVERIEKERA